ncbi:UDP-N-acetylmuramoyl-L-alanyl-D-glutamate--2,6-diaminopimelate ligase [Candidatus Nomurabacteria bacterium]|nr:UDP-N-acetylmuramoyl-L-alanyl-D-glutamate--2,6-diaminopimelate ligase [Candidatus Nomurabacteria bacterium]
MLNMLKNLKIKRRIITFLARMHFFGNPSSKLKVVGVTGTSGKTTTVTLLYRIALSLGYKAGLISTVENLINGEKIEASYNVPSTTPDPIFLNKLLNKMVKEGCEYVFMEVSSHAMDQNRVAGVHFAGGIFTNLSQDHFDYHKNFENYFKAKKKFFRMLPSDSFALSNTDDKYGDRILEGIEAQKYSYGFSDGEDFHGEIGKLYSGGSELIFNNNEIKSKLLGKFNAYNLLSVFSASSLLGFNEENVIKIIETVEPPRGRFEHFTSPNGVLIIVDYAHKPDALEKILLAVKETKQADGRIISVFGCGGDRDVTKRPIMAKIGAKLSDMAIFTSDNPRSEDPEKIINDMKEGLDIEDFQKVKNIPNRREAILEAVRIAEKGDIILCAGKGHEDYQEINGVKYHFDDMEEFKKAYAK